MVIASEPRTVVTRHRARPCAEQTVEHVQARAQAHEQRLCAVPTLQPQLLAHALHIQNAWQWQRTCPLFSSLATHSFVALSLVAKAFRSDNFLGFEFLNLGSKEPILGQTSKQ